MRRALVLGGGGPIGIAWEAGLLAGLAEEGVDVGAADFIVGTSAGSFVGAQIAMGLAASALAAAQTAERTSRPPANGAAPPKPPDLRFLMRKMLEAADGQRPGDLVRAEIGAWALKAETISQADFIASFGRTFAALPDDFWPTKSFACTAVDAADGAFKVWDRDSGVDLKRAVASSCSVPGVYPPITIAGRSYIDGGMRSPVSADLAAGYDRVIVVAVRIAGEAGAFADRMRQQLDSELEQVRAAGGAVALIVPDAASIEAFGPNLMDARRRAGAAQAGLRQGRSEAARVRAIWA